MSGCRDDEIFEAALDLPTAGRVGLLRRQCADDAQQARIEALLRGYDEADQFLRAPTHSRVVANTLPAEEKSGDTIGRYTLVEKLGEGGCGVVWRAEQREPVKRDVALKVIKLGMDTREVIARFEAERQALALMDHPNIAKVHDGGATGSGRPYFVMELVRGVPITRYCDEARLSTEARLTLFIDVCHAIQHAHQKGIIHRDLKPSNILVAVESNVGGVPSPRGIGSMRGEGTPPTWGGANAMPKIIDFGIAKATQGRLTDATLFTAVQQFIGTPAYMSPEQAGLDGSDIDTRSDIYSLGVLLYELLTGRPPFDPKTLSSSGLDEVRRIIREVDPPRPSTMARTRAVGGALRPDSLHPNSADAKTSRGVMPLPPLPAASAAELRGDLDWIVMKALEKNRTRRYESASAFAADVRRFLAHEPILARPPSAAYTFNRFVRRHRVLFGSAAAILATLLLGVGASTWQAFRATRAEREQSRLRVVESTQRQRAETAERAAVRRAYAADMNVAHQALANDNLGRARELLDAHRPQPGEPDLRGWEWRYLWQKCRADAPVELGREAGGIAALVPSHDGHWLAIATKPDDVRPGRLRIRDLRSQTQADVPTDGDFFRVAFAPNAPLLAIALSGNSPRMRLWDVSRGQQIREWPAPANCVGVHFSADGAELLAAFQVASTSGQTLLWLKWPTAASVPHETRVAEVQCGEVLSVEVTPDLRRAAFVDAPNAITFVDLVTGTKRWTVPVELAWANDPCAISPDGRFVATSGAGTRTEIMVWDQASGRKLGELPGHSARVLALAFTVDGRFLVSGGVDQTIRVWDLESRTLVRTLRGHERAVTCVAPLPGQHRLVSGTRSGVVCLWDRAKPPAPPPLSVLDRGVVNWRFADDGHSVIAVAPTGEVTRQSGRDYAAVETLLKLDPRLQLPFLQLATRVDTPKLAAAMPDGRIQIWDWGRRSQCGELITGRPDVRPKGFLERGRRLLAWSKEPSGTGVLREWDVERAVELRSWPVPRRAWYPNEPEFGGFEALSSDERQFWMLDAIGTLVRIDLVSPATLVTQLDVQNPWNLMLSPDGSRLIVRNTFASEAKVWNAHTFQPVATLPGYGAGNAGGLGFSPDGRRLAMGGHGPEGLRLWDVESWEPVLALPTPTFLGQTTAFSPDGNVIGAQSIGKFLFLWRAPSWAEIAAAEKEGRWR